MTTPFEKKVIADEETAEKDFQKTKSETTPPAPVIPPGANPATMDFGGVPARDLTPPDANSNPAARNFGSPVAPNPTGQVQTTVDLKTTTIHPNSTLTNPVMPDGTPHSVKKEKA